MGVQPELLWLVDGQPRRIIKENRAGAVEGVDAAVRARADDVVLEQDGAAQFGLEERRVHVAANIFFTGLLAAIGVVVLAPLGKSLFG